MGENGRRLQAETVGEDATISLFTSPEVLSTDIANNPGDWRFLGVAIGFLVVILGTAGNGLTVCAYKSNRNLQTSFNVLIANLCCVELLFSLVIIPLQLPGMIMATAPYPHVICTIAGYLYYCSYTASLHNLVAIAINRYIGIVNTKRYQGLFTGNRLRMWVISIWITSPILYIPLAAGGNIGWRENTLRCAIGSGNSNIGIYNMVLTILFQAGGLITLIALYSAIIIKVKRVQMNLKLHKQQSFRSSATSIRRAATNKDKDIKGDIHTPGTTSGEEDYRPSSIISGGFQFRPAKDGNPEWQSDSAPSDHELVSARTRNLMSDNNQSLGSNMTPLRTPSPTIAAQEKAKRRSFLRQLLFKKKDKGNIEENENRDHTIDLTTDDESKRNHTNDQKEQLEDVKVIPRNMDQEKKNLRRKKSLSAPTMPTPEEIMASRKNSSIATKIPEKLTESRESVSPDVSPTMNRSYTIGAKYKKRIDRGVNSGSFRIPRDSKKFLHPSAITNRISAEDRIVCSSLPSLQPSGVISADVGHHVRSGTIAKKIKDQMSRRDRRTKRKERLRTMRRRHNRERQLVYSSLWICIAYAVLLLPTSIIYVSQSIFRFTAPASVVLIAAAISWLHSVVNPFIYGYMNHLYRKEYRKIAKTFERKITTCVK